MTTTSSLRKVQHDPTPSAAPPSGEKKSKIALIAIIVGGIAGVAIVGLGAAQIFGTIGSAGFAISLSAGGIVTFASGGGLAYFAIENCKNQTKETKEPQRPLSREPNPAVQPLPVVVQNTPKKTPVDEDIRTYLNEDLGEKEISKALQRIPAEFFHNKSQVRAKKTFSDAMQHVCKSNVHYPKACAVDNLETLMGALDPDIFRLSASKGVQDDIPRSSKDAQHVHVYQVASQYNAAEAPHAFTPAIGEAMHVSVMDRTQGPLAQRTNPAAFELVIGLLTHLGFNMLHEVLPSAGKTYQVGAPIEHGYLRPTSKTLLEKLTQEFKDNYHKAEYVCYSSLPSQWKGQQPVHLFLQAAPAIGYSKIKESSDELQKYAALANYLALFKYGVDLATVSGQPVVLHAAAVGGGVFGNKLENLQWGFEKAALALQSQMKSANVSVQLEAYQELGTMQSIAQNLKIPSRPRIGDHS